jgi:hypothetical protein
MKLEVISGGGGFGINYHMRVLLYPIPFKYMSKFIAFSIRNFIRFKSRFAYLGLRYKRKLSRSDAKQMSQLYFKLECLRQSYGFCFIIRKLENEHHPIDQ